MLYYHLLENNRYISLLGILIVLSIAIIFSKNRSKINFKIVLSALTLQLLIGLAILKTNIGQVSANFIVEVVNNIYIFAEVGTKFVFGNLINSDSPWGFIFAFKVLPITIFFGALISLLIHFGVIQFFVSLVNFILRPILGTSGPETLCAIANSFLGQTTGPFLVKDYLHIMTNSEILVVMTSGMSAISAVLLAVYSKMNIPANHLLTATIMSIPASILMAKILYPETEKSKTEKDAVAAFHKKSENIFDAIAQGTFDGLSLALNVGALLIVFIALISLIDFILIFFGQKIGLIEPLNLGYIFGKVFLPFSYMLGLSGTDAVQGAELLGTKLTINEMVAYSKMSFMNLSLRAQTILTYALCGFSNFASIGIQIGVIGSLALEKRHVVTELGLLALLGSSLANLLSALFAGLLT